MCSSQIAFKHKPGEIIRIPTDFFYVYVLYFLAIIINLNHVAFILRLILFIDIFLLIDN